MRWPTFTDRLRAIRDAHGYSHRELSKQAGVTNDFISQIEAAKIKAARSALKRVLDGNPIGLSEFFAYIPERQGKKLQPGDAFIFKSTTPHRFKALRNRHCKDLC